MIDILNELAALMQVCYLKRPARKATNHTMLGLCSNKCLECMRKCIELIKYNQNDQSLPSLFAIDCNSNFV